MATLAQQTLYEQSGVDEALPGGFLRLRLSSGSIPLPSQEFSGLILVNLRDEPPPLTGQQPSEEPAGIPRPAPTGVHGQTHEPQSARLAPLGEPSLARLSAVFCSRSQVRGRGLRMNSVRWGSSSSPGMPEAGSTNAKPWSGCLRRLFIAPCDPQPARVEVR